MMGAGQDQWITISHFRTHMSRVLREFERGKTFTVVRRGRAVARVIGYAPHSIGSSVRRRSAEPRIPLFKSGIPDLASRVDDHLAGFGEDR